MAHRCISTSLLAELLKATEQVHQRVTLSLLPNQGFDKERRVRNISAVLVFGQLLRQLVQHSGRKIRIVAEGISQLFERIQRLRALPASAASALATNSVVASFLLLSLFAGVGAVGVPVNVGLAFGAYWVCGSAAAMCFARSEPPFQPVASGTACGWPVVYPDG